MKRTAALLFSSALLSACSFNPFSLDNTTTGSAAGVLVGGAAGAGVAMLAHATRPFIALAGIGGAGVGYYSTTLRSDASGIYQAGGQAYQVGDTLGIYIPTDYLFESNTAYFMPNYDSVLSSVVAVLNRKPNNNIIISGNSGGFYRSRGERQLSERRAEKVAAYLWNAGISQFTGFARAGRRLNYVGYGDYFPISTHLTNEGLRQNSRIQIVSYSINCAIAMPEEKVKAYPVAAPTDLKGEG